MKFHTSALFRSQKKKLGKMQLQSLNEALEKLKKQPRLGVAKTGDLQGIYIYIFHDGIGKVLLGYKLNEESTKIKLLTLSRISEDL